MRHEYVFIDIYINIYLYIFIFDKIWHDVNDSRHSLYEGVMSCTNDSCDVTHHDTCECVMSPINHVIHKWVMSHVNVSWREYIFVYYQNKWPRRSHTGDMTGSYLTWLVCIWHDSSIHIWHDSLISSVIHWHQVESCFIYTYLWLVDIMSNHVIYESASHWFIFDMNHWFIFDMTHWYQVWLIDFMSSHVIYT